MSEKTEFSLDDLFALVQKEMNNEAVQEVNPLLYTMISDSMGNLVSGRYDKTEAKINAKLVSMFSRLVKILIDCRLQKARAASSLKHVNLTDVEKFMLDALDEMHDRRKTVTMAILAARSGLLESISQKHKTRLVTLRFLTKYDEMVGADLEKYGPFEAEDVATIPYENAQLLISQNIASRIKNED